MDLAIEEAKKAASEGDIPVGAVVVYKDEVIGRGRNLRRIDHDPTSHAEIVAIREAAKARGSWNLSGCEIYVTLEPCPMCAGAIVQSRIAKVVYGCTDPKAGASGTLYDITRDTRLNHRCEVIKGIEENRCRKMLQDFFVECRNKKRKTNDTSLGSP
ncbi:tRNA adenosine(34) deaminase TadA [Dethiosulfovibrio sp. F2B]|nr:tRNA adenosine(34) deaminase TadA [Dethiosulfovibrio faecalis]MCF4150241.1 tRNA adenosine(34) deaminase TadA [Dethiosulfovibrio faecalis]